MAIWLTTMRLVIFVVNIKSYFVSFAKTYMIYFSFEQSTRKCRWECYDGQAKFLDELKREASNCTEEEIWT